MTPEEIKAADNALIKEVASKLKGKSLFPDQIARAKALLRALNTSEAKSKKA